MYNKQERCRSRLRALRGFKCHAAVPRGVLCLRAHARARSVVGNGASAICWTPRGGQPPGGAAVFFFKLVGLGTVLMLQMLPARPRC